MADRALRGHSLGSKSLSDSSGVELAARHKTTWKWTKGHASHAE